MCYFLLPTFMTQIKLETVEFVNMYKTEKDVSTFVLFGGGGEEG